MLQHPAAVRAAFEEAAEVFVDTIRAVPSQRWDRPGALGEWSVRELAAHTLRAFSTIETYAATEPSEGDRLVADAGEYYAQAFTDPAIHAAVAERGRVAGAQFSDPPGMTEVVVQRVLALVASLGDDDEIVTLVGRMAFSEYLVTRTVELAVHTLDLQRATDQPLVMTSTTAAVVTAILVELGDPAQIVLALTGRRSLPDGYNVLA